MSYVIASTNGVTVIVDIDGYVATVDSSQGEPVVFDKLVPKPTPPMTLAASHGGGVEACVVVDAAGNCWRGPIRQDGRKFEHIGKLPQRKATP